MNQIMPIVDLLMERFDKLRRNASGTIVYDNQLKEISKNFLNDEILKPENFDTYYEVFNALTNKFHVIMNIFKIPKGCKSEYKYVNDVLTKEIWQFWKPEEQVFISAGTGRGKNTFIKKELLEYCNKHDQPVVIFENRQSLMQQQVKDIISDISPEALPHYDMQKDSMFIFGAHKNIMIISYQSAALKCIFGDLTFSNFYSKARYLIFDEAHYILDDSYYNKGINFFSDVFLKKLFPECN